jgi:type IV pilus assembly protein PilA
LGIGVIALIALPSFLNKANKAKQAEAKQFIEGINRSQQAYFLEQKSFSRSMDVPSQPENYTFHIENTENYVFVSAIPKTSDLKSYVGMTWVLDVGGKKTTSSRVCELEKAASEIPSMPQAPPISEKVECPSGYIPVR